MFLASWLRVVKRQWSWVFQLVMKAAKYLWEDFGHRRQPGGRVDFSWKFPVSLVPRFPDQIWEAEHVWWITLPPPEMFTQTCVRWYISIHYILPQLVEAFKLGIDGGWCHEQRLLFLFCRMRNVFVLVLLQTWVSWRDWKRKWASTHTSKRRCLLARLLHGGRSCRVDLRTTRVLAAWGHLYMGFFFPQ